MHATWPLYCEKYPHDCFKKTYAQVCRKVCGHCIPTGKLPYLLFIYCLFIVYLLFIYMNNIKYRGKFICKSFLEI